MSDFEKLINASALIGWIMEAYPDWCVGDVRSIVDHVEDMPSAQPDPCVDTIDALDESIKHFDDIAEECRRNANIERNDYMDMRDDAAEYRQLSIWLNELKWLRERFQSQPDLDEWCPGCKEYDSKRHCCPRFNRVIREALKEGLTESTDAIGRQVAIDIIQSYKKNTERLKEISVEDVVDMFEDLIDDIENESSVRPVRENGTWEKDELFGESAYVCTNCETIWTTGQIKNMHFCPTCGSDMRGDYNGGVYE